MKQKRYRITAIIFTLLGLLIIGFSGMRPLTFPTQQVDLPPTFGFGPILPEVIIRQEITLKKDYLQAVEVVMGNSSNTSGIDNLMMVVDGNGSLLATVHFDSRDITTTNYYRLDLDKNIRIGKGNKVWLCFTSTNANPQQNISLVRDLKSRFGQVSVTPVLNGDVMTSLGGKWDLFEGSMVLKTFETNSGYWSWLHWLLALGVLAVGLLVFFFPDLRATILRIRLKPEWAYGVIALLFGSTLVFLTPPLQSPDENKHLFRAWQVAGLNLFQHDPTVPKAFQDVAKNYERLNFMHFSKTNSAEKARMMAIRVNRAERVTVDLPREFVPFLPQAMGIAIGRIFTDSALALMYWGRMFNLLVSIVILFLAIRITPAGKWLFLSIALMPMTAFLFASLSHDVLTISIAILFVAYCLRLAFGEVTLIARRELVLFLLLTLLLALCKQPYYLSVFLFLLVPVKRVGTMKKYLMVFGTALLLVAAGSQVAALGAAFKPAQQPVASDTRKAGTTGENYMEQTKTDSLVNPARQKQFILSSPVRYAGIVISTIRHDFYDKYVQTMIGRLGWLSLFLPVWLINMVFLILLLVAMLDSNPGVSFGWRSRALIAVTAGVIIILIETAMYLVWTPVGTGRILGIQGRYFIPVLPVLLLLLYNRKLAPFLTTLKFASAGTGNGKRGGTKIKIKEKEKVTKTVEDGLFFRFFHMALLLFIVVSLLVTLFKIIDKYYVVLC